MKIFYCINYRKRIILLLFGAILFLIAYYLTDKYKENLKPRPNKNYEEGEKIKIPISKITGLNLTTRIEIISLIGILYRNEKEQFYLNLEPRDKLTTITDIIQIYEYQLKMLEKLEKYLSYANEEYRHKNIDEIIKMLKIMENNEDENFKLNNYQKQKFDTNKMRIDIYINQLKILDLIKKIALNETENKFMADYVKKIIELNQNPKNCNTAEFLICKHNRDCGFGCQFHFYVSCFQSALYKQKVLILEPPIFEIGEKYEDFFKPLSSSCSPKNIVNKSKIEYLTKYSTISKMPYSPLVVPSEIFINISLFHTKPQLWWIGQLCSYLFRFQPKTADYIEVTKKQINPKSPLACIHVRRTDKIGIEANYFNLSEYMLWVDIYFKKMKTETDNDTKYVYLSSDDIILLQNAKKEYPNYTFINNKEARKDFDQNRNTKNGIFSIINDIHILSNCDFLVCTFSSNVCRLAYELMNSRGTDASENFKSLDNEYLFAAGSQRDFKTLIPHKKRNNMEADISENSNITLWQGDWQGTHSYIINDYTKGYIPSYKIYENIRSLPFKSFDVHIDPRD